MNHLLACGWYLLNIYGEPDDGEAWFNYNNLQTFDRWDIYL